MKQIICHSFLYLIKHLIFIINICFVSCSITIQTPEELDRRAAPSAANAAVKEAAAVEAAAAAASTSPPVY